MITRILIILLIVFTSTACTPSLDTSPAGDPQISNPTETSPVGDPQTSNPTPTVNWVIEPILLLRSDAGDNWSDYTVVLAIENTGSEWAYPSFYIDGLGKVTTEEGYVYDATSNLNLVNGINQIIDYPAPKFPPGFRAHTYLHNFSSFVEHYTNEIKFRAATGSNPKRVEFSNIAFDLAGLPVIEAKSEGMFISGIPNALKPDAINALSGKGFPTQNTGSSSANDRSILFPDKGELTFGDTTDNLWLFSLPVSFQNFSGGYDTEVKEMCYLFDSKGVISFPKSSDIFRINGLVKAGPGQTLTGNLSYGIDEEGKVLENAQLICTGEIDQIIKIGN